MVGIREYFLIFHKNLSLTRILDRNKKSKLKTMTKNLPHKAELANWQTLKIKLKPSGKLNSFLTKCNETTFEPTDSVKCNQAEIEKITPLFTDAIT